MSSLTERDPELETLLEYLKERRGFDFTGYKRASLGRRITKRMQTLRVETYAQYRDDLEANPGEFQQLFDTILINVTSFFRDADAWEFLRQEIVPRILSEKDAIEPIRIWSAGCATGEEAYTLGILLAEQLGTEGFRERVKIYATDVDESALTVARHATYAPKDLEGLPQEIVEKYFDRSDSRAVFRKDLRRCVVFGRNDLIQDAPISRIDLLVCRNLLMYFDANTQARIVSRFFYALNDTGYLFLGRAETLLTQTAMFAAVDVRRRVFQKAARAQSIRGAMMPRWPAPTAETAVGVLDVRDAAFRAGVVAQLVVDRQGTLVFANDRAGMMFRLGFADVGRPLSDLDVSYRPMELRSLVDQAYAERRIITRAAVEWRQPATGETRWFDLHVIPLHSEEGGVVGASLAFTDVTAQRQLQGELEQSEYELQAAHEELQSTNEELETTNEELQSMVAELETTNEELQSTNEELETMNEELQSTNEELQTMNDELRVRGDQVGQLNRFLEQVFTSLKDGVAVLDPELRILVWNTRAEDLWGVRADEARGSHFLNLDIGLPVEQLRQPIRNALAVGDGVKPETVLPATNRRGKRILCRVVCAPLLARDAAEPDGVIVLMDEVSAAD